MGAAWPAGGSMLVLAALAALAVTAAPRVAQQQSAEAPPRAYTVLVTGANRGLGLEFARQFREAGATVIGTARVPAEAAELRGLGVRVEQLDVTDPASVRGLAERLRGEPIDILVNNAGTGGRVESIDNLDVEEAARVIAVNCLGPMRVTQALLPSLRAGTRKTLVNITSRLGSIGLNAQGAYYGYRESKAALNMFTRSLARELQPEGFTCIVMSPGWVRTRMGGPGAPLEPCESVAGMMQVISRLGPAESGRFLDYRGEELPW